MTREEALKKAINIVAYFEAHFAKSKEARENAANIIEALEQEPILDKIRAEIEDIAFDWQEIDGEHESFMVVDLNDALQIIDKYRSESEDNE